MTVDRVQIESESNKLPQAEADAARLAWNIAASTCLAASDSFPGCADYHGIYPLLHALGMAATPDRHADFYARELGRAAQSGGHPSVLVSGSADHGMLEHVVRAYKGSELRLEMLDLCPTPGRLCEAWAIKQGVPIKTHACNILEWQPGRQYDLITTHSFIPKFVPATRAQLFAAWSRLLRPCGALISTVRIDPEPDTQSIGFDEAQAQAFADTLVAVTEPWGDQLEIDAEQLHAAALRHCDGIKSYPLESVAELRSLLESNGFTIQSLEQVYHQGKLKDGQSGAGTHRSAEYADFVAVRD